MANSNLKGSTFFIHPVTLVPNFVDIHQHYDVNGAIKNAVRNINFEVKTLRFTQLEYGDQT
jgi:hypothetical protein